MNQPVAQMSLDDICDQLDRIFDTVLPNEEIPERQRTRANCPDWTSLANLNLILSIEEEFGVTVSDDEAADLDSYKAALQIVCTQANLS